MMASNVSWPVIAAQTIYYAYPDSDLLPIDPPATGETIDVFALRAEAAADTLFLFLCREASDEIDVEEYLNRLDRAQRDIYAVREAFEAHFDDTAAQQLPTADSPP